jgi:membrane dipeptidase
MLDRRSLLTLAAGASGVAIIPAHAKPIFDEDPLRNRIVINSLGGFETSDVQRDGRGQAAATIDRQKLHDAIASGTTAANQTIGYVSGENEPFEQTVREIALWDAVIRNDPQIIKVFTTQDIKRAKVQHKLGLMLGFQNAAMMGDRIDRVDIFADLGIKVIQLTYNNENLLGGGSLTPGNPGLTHFGREVIQHLNTRGVIVDLSHSGQQTCLDAVRTSIRPIAVTHTGCRALVDHPRNTTDEALRLVASRGGYVGIYFMPFLAAGRNATPEDLLAHIEHAINVCGEDHVGIGTDGGTSKIDLEAFKVEWAKQYEQRRAAGIAAPGEGPGTLTFIPELSGPDQFRSLARRLAERGHNTARIDKILGLNFLRFARDVWES